jgi:hypothetical protein
MATLQEYHGRFAIGSDRDSLSFDGTALTLTSGRYYICGYTGETPHQLCEHMEEKLQTVHASATCRYDRATGRVTITTGAGSVTITWTDAGLGSLLGFAGNLSGASSYTAPNQPRYVWRPGEGLSEYPLDPTLWWGSSSSTRSIRAPDGTTSTVVSPAMLYAGTYGYSLLSGSEVFTSSTTVWESLQCFWEDVAAAGMRIRIFPDRTSYASSADCTHAIWKMEKEITDFVTYAKRHFQQMNSLWNVSFELQKAIG